MKTVEELAKEYCAAQKKRRQGCIERNCEKISQGNVELQEVLFEAAERKADMLIVVYQMKHDYMY